MLCQPSTCSLTVLAPAKLNLFLRVIRRRTDGFHDLETVMTSVDLFDTLIFEPSVSPDISLKVVMAAPRNQNSLPPAPIPLDSDNLVIRSARLLNEYAGTKFGVGIVLIKRIPSAAGMGGWFKRCRGNSGRPESLLEPGFWIEAELLTLAARLGSDIGFFLGGTSMAICRGRGELVEPLQLPLSLHFVIARPATGLSTPEVFKRCRPKEMGKTADEFVSGVKRAGLGRTVRLLLNDLQSPAESLNEDVGRLRKQFEALPVLGHQMSGSGTSYFGVCASSRHAEMIAARLRAAGVPWVHVARSCS